MFAFYINFNKTNTLFIRVILEWNRYDFNYKGKIKNIGVIINSI